MSWKSSLGYRWLVGFNDNNMQVFIFKEVNRRDEYINSLIFFSFFLLCLRMMNTERLSTQFPLKYNSFIALKRLFTPTRLKAFPSLSAVRVQLWKFRFHRIIHFCMRYGCTCCFPQTILLSYVLITSTTLLHLSTMEIFTQFEVIMSFLFFFIILKYLARIPKQFTYKEFSFSSWTSSSSEIHKNAIWIWQWTLWWNCSVNCSSERSKMNLQSQFVSEHVQEVAPENANVNICRWLYDMIKSCSSATNGACGEIILLTFISDFMSVARL